MLAISHRHGDPSRAINTFLGNLFVYVWHFKEDLLCRIPQYLRLAHMTTRWDSYELMQLCGVIVM